MFFKLSWNKQLKLCNKTLWQKVDGMLCMTQASKYCICKSTDGQIFGMSWNGCSSSNGKVIDQPSVFTTKLENFCLY